MASVRARDAGVKDIGHSGCDAGNNRQGVVDPASQEKRVDDDGADRRRFRFRRQRLHLTGAG
jgi:hypothetical protein